MNEDNATLIHEIAVKHGVLLGKDDPILILQTMNAKLVGSTTEVYFKAEIIFLFFLF